MCSDDIAVKQRDLPAVFHQEHGQYLSGRRLPGATQTGEPDADALAVPRRTAFRKDFGD